MATLLPLHDYEITMVLFALNDFAAAQEQDGDACGYAPMADAVAARVRALGELVHESAVRQLKAIGLGRYERRPQG